VKPLFAAFRKRRGADRKLFQTPLHRHNNSPRNPQGQLSKAARACAYKLRDPSPISRPPRILTKLVSLIARTLENPSLLGDLEEEYRTVARWRGSRRARLWYLGHLVASLPAFAKSLIMWRIVMIKNYLKVAMRNIVRHKGYAFLNIAGLALGLAGAILISLWVLDELSFNRFHENADSLYRVEFDQDYSGKLFHVGVTPLPLAPALKEAVPEIVDAARYFRVGEFLVRVGDSAFYEDNARVADPSFLRMFTFPALEGDPVAALSGPDSIVLTESAARRYFGGAPAFGRTVNINNQRDVVVRAIIRDGPANSDLRFNVLIPYAYLTSRGPFEESWTSNSIQTFVLLRPGLDPPAIAAKIQGVVGRHRPVEDVAFSLQPLADLHLRSHMGFEAPGGAARYVSIFSMAAAIVLLIACINFMNLATARSSRRALEVGLRKVVGARRSQVIGQFFGESVLFAALALVLAAGLVAALLPAFNGLTGKSIGFGRMLGRPILPGLAALTLLTGILAGTYPAVVLSSLRPVTVLKGLVRAGLRSAAFRKALVVAQFAASAGLIIGTAVVFRQIDFMRGQAPGFDREHVVALQLHGDIVKSYEPFKRTLLRNPRVLGVTLSTEKPSLIGSNSDSVDWEGKDPNWSLSTNMLFVDLNFPEATGIPVVAGRGFTGAEPSAEQPEFLINETLARLIGADPVVGIRFSYGGPQGKVVGVLKDFHFDSLQSKIEPLVVLRGRQDYFRYILVRLDKSDVREGMKALEAAWKEVIPNYPFQYTFLDQDFNDMYRTEQRMGGVLRAFAAFAVLIACLGLFGLAAYAAERRTKEIGIRKILGATTPEIVALLCREFLLLIALANLIAAPVAYILMKNWLGRYAYRTELGVTLFAGVLVASLAAGLVTVIFQALRAASANPSTSLRYE
jgi:putative ABC transport system permease protein